MRASRFVVSIASLALALPAFAHEAKKPAGKAEHRHEEGDVCHHPETAEAAPAPADKNGVVLRGEKLKGAPAVTLSALLKSPEAHDGKTVTVEGRVRKACQRKGCWMELAESEKGAGVRVTFKDYGFFVPLDSAGRRAKVEGQVKVAALSEETARHYESEGAIVPRGADGKPREVQLVAAGVELRPAAESKPK